MRSHPLFDELDASLAALGPRIPVELTGEWLPFARRTYQRPSQKGSGDGPFVDVVDLRWRGTLACSAPIAGIAFLVTEGELFWSKSAPAEISMPVDVSLHAYADYSPELASVTASIGHAGLPGTTVPCRKDVAAACTVRQDPLTTFRVEPMAHAGETAFAVLLIEGQYLQVGRHRLWRVRDKLASSLPPHVREILTRGRSGSVPA